MAKVIVVYESRYGNTKLVAEKIMEQMNGVKGIEANVSEFKKVDFHRLPEYDAILVGTPTHFGGPTRGAKKFVDRLEKLDLKGKTFAAFDTYLGDDFEKAAKKLEERIREKVSGSRLATPGLSMKVQGTKGPVADDELSKVKEFVKRIAKQIKT